MSRRWHHHQHDKAKLERREREFPNVPETVFAKLGVPSATIAALEDRMYGHIVMPGMADYPGASKGKGLSVFDQGEPLMVFRCLDVLDVWLALEATYRHGWGFVARSGGHSTAGFSSNAETVIDLAGLDGITLLEGARVSVDAGVTFKKFNRFMKLHGLHVPTGGCDDVCVAGYVQGGGWGYTSRQFGIQCDRVVEATVMLADGRTVRASECENPDLFWAIRGGTGNNFGVLLNVVFEAVPMKTIWGFAYAWKGDDAPRAMERAQIDFGIESGLEIGYSANITTLAEDGGHTPVFMMMGVCVEGRKAGREALAPMLAIGDPVTVYDETGPYDEINAAVEGSLPGIPAPIDNTFELKSSAYIPAPIPLDGCRAIWRYFVAGIEGTNPYNMLYCEMYGGAINRVPKEKTAFIHRDVVMDIYVDAFWSADGRLGSYDAARAWLDGVDAVIAPYSNDHWYQNYPQRDMPDYRWRYWGDAFAGLLFVKRKYDPLNRFRFEQSVSPYPDDPAIRRSSAPSQWSDPEIAFTDLTGSFVQASP